MLMFDGLVSDVMRGVPLVPSVNALAAAITPVSLDAPDAVVL